MPARALHLLDIGTQQYGDCLLYESGSATVLFDGGHEGDDDLLFDQLKELVPRSGETLEVSLLVVTHAHKDHIGALPSLVADGRLAAEWALVADPGFGWGRTRADTATPLDSVSDAMRGLVAALREEPPSRSMSDSDLRQFISDAASGEDKYREMLDTLRANGTRVVRHGRDRASALVSAFRSVGLEIHGPTKAHLDAATAEVVRAQRDAIAAADAVMRADATGDPVGILRRLAARPLAADAMSDAMTDALADAQSRNGAAVNSQSTVVSLKAGRWRTLLAGDMQFASSVDAIEPHVRALRRRLKKAGAFDVFKLSHHGATNGWDEDLYEEVGKPRYLAISLGDHAGKHPDRDVLDDLRSLSKVTWARSDVNGHVRFGLGASKVTVTKERGRLNDPTPPRPDVAAAPFGGIAVRAGDVAEIVTRAPHGVPVTITVGGGPPRALGSPSARERAGPLPALDLFSGRTLPRLLFVTSRDALAERIGVAEAAHVLDALRRKGTAVYDTLPAGVGWRAAQAAVHEQVRAVRGLAGVVLIGGYSSVPSQRLFCLPPDLQGDVRPEEDPHDSFLVWSDDFYVDLNGDGRAELPITRVPDGRNPELVFAQLQADARPRSASVRRVGIRNRERPFADDVFASVPGAGAMLQSAPATIDDPPHLVDGDVSYVMLHGSDLDGTLFCGQLGEDGSPEKWPAVGMRNIPSVCGPVVFTGCCWGALITAQPADRTPEGSPIGSRTADQSLALRILRQGATAFIGVTGAHYSPDPPGVYHGGAMHHAFFRSYKPGGSPAEALFAAKADFLRNIPHGQTDPLMAALDVKIHAEYTCLGLGW